MSIIIGQRPFVIRWMIASATAWAIVLLCCISLYLPRIEPERMIAAGIVTFLASIPSGLVAALAIRRNDIQLVLLSQFLTIVVVATTFILT